MPVLLRYGDALVPDLLRPADRTDLALLRLTAWGYWPPDVSDPDPRYQQQRRLRQQVYQQPVGGAHGVFGAKPGHADEGEGPGPDPRSGDCGGRQGGQV